MKQAFNSLFNIVSTKEPKINFSDFFNWVNLCPQVWVTVSAFIYLFICVFCIWVHKCHGMHVEPQGQAYENWFSPSIR